MELFFLNGKTPSGVFQERFKHFGEGLFETLRWERGTFQTPIEYHYERLSQGAQFFRIPYPPFEEFETFVKKLLEGYRHLSGPLYVKVLLLSLGEGYFAGEAKSYRLEGVVKPYTPPKGQLVLTVSPFKRHSANPLWRFKTTNFLFNIAVKREAASRGYFDALILNEKGRVTETSSANFYCLKGEKLLTPPVEEGLLPGILRRVLLEEGRAVERSLTLEDLSRCEKFFISNSLLGLREVKVDLSSPSGAVGSTPLGG